MKRFLVLLAEGFEETEAVATIDVLRRGGVDVVLCSLGGERVEGSRHIIVQADTTIDAPSLDTFDGIYLPGGAKGAMTLRDDPRAQKLIRSYYDAGKKVAAICAAPIALERAGILKGKKVTSNPDFQNHITDAEYLEDPVVVSGNIITSRAAGTAIAIGLEILRQLGLVDQAKQVSHDMLFDFLLANRDKIEA
ncbi:DJ-1 family glyoxalase III [Sporolactobacillus spathodeae]|uniref:4-methyl-5(B-hydroxyethyl)-thiazole monophosphate biosynthesis n=1 Tax=Sporolactobacillus spathodeae TaxID=1465502 RepID=A0ABS2QAB0_9BACL|nr:DJ-1 family glyoxalase III [Sporolactobacillus spathodeae]MBM7658729.1 4-methyl-5(b-hydroxyethyl)-thiazole monophosphate biosynthesis [Sporolactobacillus spathodeae]